MARKTKEQQHQELWEAASRQLNEIVTGCEEDRELAVEDRRFYSIAGAQWEGAIGQQFQKRPKIEVNKIHLSIIRIINEYRNNRVSAMFISKDGKDVDEIADTIAGLYRADQQDSNADEAHDNAFEEAVGGGFGAFRLTNKYEDDYDEEDDRQRICWEPITDADTCVFFDPNSKKQDKSDAKYCFVLTGMSREAFEKEWGEDAEGWDRPIEEDHFDWNTPDLVYVAEYFVCEDKSEKVYTYRNISGEFEKYWDSELDDKMRAELNDIGSIMVAERSIKKRKVRKYFLSGGGVLEDAGYIAGKCIPIVPVYGKRWFVDGKERFMGHVRLVKDPQRLYNMQVSVLAENAASGGEEVPIVTPEQISGHENAWANRAVNKPAYLPINPLENAAGDEIPSGPVDYTRPPQVPAQLAALLQLAGQDIEDLLGNQDAGEEIETNMSGKAVELIQNRLDMQSFIYMSNFAKAEKRSAEIWLSMASEIYGPEDRKMKVIDAQESIDYVDMSESYIDDEGSPREKFDLSKAKYDVAVEIGPTSASKRSATVRSLTQMLPLLADPQDQAVISAMTLMNMEGEGIGPVRDYFRKKLIQMGVVEPTDKEAKEMAAEMQAQEQGPTAQDQYLMAEAQKSQAQAMESEADAMEAVANTEKKKAETIKTLADIDREAQEAAIDAFKAISDARPDPAQNGSSNPAPARPMARE